jgi:hypothetical protein
LRSFLRSEMEWESGDQPVPPRRCEVRISEAEVFIRYTHSGSEMLWRGHSGDGVVYDCHCIGHAGHRALLRREEHFLLVGTWKEGRSGGTWRIDLDDRS